MKTISLWQPWASLWCSPAKVHETRHWYTAHRGWTLVHAAKKKVKIEDDDPLAEVCRRTFGEHWRTTVPYGAVIGSVEIIGCFSTNAIATGKDDLICGDFTEGRYAWARNRYAKLLTPVPWRGQQGFFDVESPGIFAQMVLR